MNTVYLNGTLTSAEQAKVSVFDRGFLFGDGVYEVIPFYQGRAFGWEGHMERFSRSMTAIQINNPHSEKEWRDVAKSLLKANGDTQLMYLQVTRGISQPRKHTFEKDMQPTVVVSSFAFTPVNTQGASVITQQDDRWQHCYIKSLNLLPNVLAVQAAKDEEAVEAILIRDGFVTEGASSNVFMIKNNQAFTSKTDGSILKGITRGIILDILKSLSINIIEGPIALQDLEQADEIWISSVGKEITPVIRMNDKPIGQGKPGPVWQRAYPAYQDCIAHDAKAL